MSFKLRNEVQVPLSAHRRRETALCGLKHTIFRALQNKYAFTPLVSLDLAHRVLILFSLNLEKS